MKRLLSLVLLTVCLASCSSCAKKLPDPVVAEAGPTPTPSGTVDPPSPPVQNPLTITGSGWEFTLPSDGWKRLETEAGGPVVLMNPSSGNLIVMTSTVFDGTLDVLTLEAIRGTRDSKATILSTKQVVLNGHNFALIEAFKGDTKVWMWVAVNGGHAFAFSCGGSGDQQTLCAGISTTFKLN